MTWSQLFLSTQGVALLKAHYSFMSQCTCTGGSPRRYSRCGRCLSCCSDVRRRAASRVHGVRWAVQMWEFVVRPAKWCNHPQLKTTQQIFCGSKRARRPFKEMELMWNPLLFVRWSRYAVRKRREKTFKDRKSISEIMPKTTPGPFLHYHCHEQLVCNSLFLSFFG